MKPSTILKKARKLIERGWCKGPMATDASGKEVSPTSKRAVCFCAAGALKSLGATNQAADEIFMRANRGTKNHPVTISSSPVTKRHVLAGFDRAIKLAVSEGK